MSSHRHTASISGNLVRRYGPASGIKNTLVKLSYNGPVSISVLGDITLLKTGPLSPLGLDQVLVSGEYEAVITLKRIDRENGKP